MSTFVNLLVLVVSFEVSVGVRASPTTATTTSRNEYFVEHRAPVGMTAPANEEQALMRTLMRYYEPSVRPVRNYSRPLALYFKMKLSQILELSEKDQILTTNIWIEQVGNQFFEIFEFFV